MPIYLLNGTDGDSADSAEFPEVAEVRALTAATRTCRRDAFDACRALFQFLLSKTIAAPGSRVRLTRMRGSQRDVATLEGPALGVPIRLNNDRFLRLDYSLALEQYGEYPTVLKVRQSSLQYEASDNRDDWIFRYDYLRTPGDQHPPAHFQIRGTLASSTPMHYDTLERMHFPTGRVTLESVIRCLIEQFDVPSNTGDPAVWRRMLAVSEKEFLRIARQPLSGPEE